MTDTNSETHMLASSWKRPDGPLNIWRRLEADERLPGGTTKRARLSIQEVPEDRHQEVIDHMLEFFLAEEATCESMKLKNCEVTREDFKVLWMYLLSTGMSVAAFKLDSDDSLLELVGVNVMYVVTEELIKELENIVKNFKSHKAKKLFEFMHESSENVNVNKLYGIDKHLSALGLSVVPAFRGQQLGVRLLEARTDIGRKYGIIATETIFTGPASQKQAVRAGFKLAYRRGFTGVLDDDGKPLFPNIKSKEIQIMTKELR